MLADFSFDNPDWMTDESVIDHSSKNFEAFDSSILDLKKLSRFKD